MEEILTFGELLKKKRKERKITLAEVGRALQLRASTISKYEKGIVKNIPLFRLLSVIDFLNITLEDIESNDCLKTRKEYLEVWSYLTSKEKSPMKNVKYSNVCSVVETLKNTTKYVNETVPCLFILSSDYSKEEFRMIHDCLDFIKFKRRKGERI